MHHRFAKIGQGAAGADDVAGLRKPSADRGDDAASVGWLGIGPIADRPCQDGRVLNVPGYPNDPLVDGSHLLVDPMFWPAHLLQCTAGHPDDLCAAFGVDEAELWLFYRRLTDERQWPVFAIALPLGHVLYVVYRNFAEDSGYDYLLHHPGWAEPILLATVEGHYLGPGLCWSELVAVSRAAAGADTTLSPQGRIGLLLPVVADADLPADAVDFLAAALHTLGAYRQPRRLAERLLDEQGLWGPQPWRMVNGTRISTAPRYATRTPEVLTNDILAEIARALAATSPTSR